MAGAGGEKRISGSGVERPIWAAFHGGRSVRAMSNAPFVLIDDNLSSGGRSLLFTELRDLVVCEDPAQWSTCIRKIEHAVERGLHAAGFLSYELGYAVEPRLSALMPPVRQAPLIYFGLFEAPRVLERSEVPRALHPLGDKLTPLDDLRTSIDKARYARDFRAVMDYIAAGDVYQVNHTFRVEFNYPGEPTVLYLELRRRQRVAHGGMVQGEDFAVLSLSPELFFRLDNGAITTRPMKGTAHRAPTLAEDRLVAEELSRDEKSQAENLMIVDLLRNDFGRIAETGSVRVPELFTVETYRTLHQMTSTVEARLKPGSGLADIIRGVFPCGSITGAPKIRAMEIIRELEESPRGVYTGAIGYLAPSGSARFNVAIRTIMLKGGKGEMGIGSGLVADSDLDAEWDECLLKAEFLTNSHEPFLLFETMRWERGKGFVLLDYHLERLRQSTEYFVYPYPAEAIERTLDDLKAQFTLAAHRVRLTLSEDGSVDATRAPLAPAEPGLTWRFDISEHVTDPSDVFLFHKTTRRELYDAEHERASRETGADEVLFFNTLGELTEGSRTNVFVESGGRLYTPPVVCGLLPGTLRRELIEKGRVEERVLTRDDLASADRVLVGNSLRGLIEAKPISSLTRSPEEAEIRSTPSPRAARR